MNERRYPMKFRFVGGFSGAELVSDIRDRLKQMYEWPQLDNNGFIASNKPSIGIMNNTTVFKVSDEAGSQFFKGVFTMGGMGPRIEVFSANDEHICGDTLRNYHEGTPQEKHFNFGKLTLKEFLIHKLPRWADQARNTMKRTARASSFTDELARVVKNELETVVIE